MNMMQLVAMTEWCPATRTAVPVFVLESKGNRKHAGVHLSTAIVAPALVILPYATKGFRWPPGILALTLCAAVSFYNYTLVSQVLKQAEFDGHRLLHFRDLVAGGPTTLSNAVCLSAIIGSTILGGQNLTLMYKVVHPDGTMQLFDFTIIYGAMMLVLSQMPSIHSACYISLASLL